MPAHPPTTPTETLSRAVVFSTQTETCPDTGERTIGPDAFRPPRQTRDVSVHRHAHVSTEEDQVRLARDVAKARRGDPDKFYGWAELPVWQAEEGGRQVIPSEDIHHADIRLPEECVNDPELLEDQLQDLAARSKWRPPPK